MKGPFESLVARAWDAAPRARPQIQPRFAPRANAPIDEALLEVEAPLLERPAATSDAPDMPSPSHATAPSPADARTNMSGGPLPEAPPTERRGALPASFPPTSPASEAKDPPVRTRIVEHVLRSTSERTRLVEVARPVAARPPPLREVDARALRPEAPRSGDRSTPREALRAFAGAAPRADANPPPVQISIGRIEVRATSTPVRPTTLPKAAHEPKLSLGDYLRQRNEGR